MFLTVLWQAGTMGTSVPPMISSFVSSLGKRLADRVPDVGILGREILNALTGFETLVPGSLYKDKDLDCAGIWLASLDSGPENLLDACVYSPQSDRSIDLFNLVQLRLRTLWSRL